VVAFYIIAGLGLFIGIAWMVLALRRSGDRREGREHERERDFS
jgi:hypothetical protein